MGGSYLGNAGAFLIQTLFGLYIFALMLRFMLQLVRADFYNPLSQFLVKVTNPVLRPVRRVVPGLLGLDWACILVMLALQSLELLLVSWIQGLSPLFVGLLLMALVELLRLMLNIVLFSIIIQVILSWVNPGAYNPMIGLLYSLTNPVLRPARRMVPPVGGMDLSPLVALLALQLISMLLLAPLSDLARGLMF